MDELLSTQDAALILGVSRQWVYHLCRTGRIVAVRVGKGYIITRDELERFQKVPRQRGRPRSKS